MVRSTAAALPFVFVLVVAAQAAYAQERAVTLAGVAYLGDDATREARFPYSHKYENQLKQAGDSNFKRTAAAVAAMPPQSLRFTAEALGGALKDQDRALVTSLVLNSETVSVERFGDVRKLFVLLRGQALFFDFKSMTVVRSYPVSFGYVDNFRHDPSEQEILERVRLVFEGAGGKPGLYARYASTLAAATVPKQVPRYLQVTQVDVAPEMLAVMPEHLKTSKGVYETWAADLVAEAISTRVGVPIVPYSKGYAIGNVMSMRVADGKVYNLKLPTPDYAISVDLKGVKKLKYGEGAGGASYIYGTFADVRIEGPLGTHLNTGLKNGEVKIVPASQTYVDDFPAFYDSLNGMFVKLAESIAGKGNGWVKSAAVAPDILAQINKTMELMQQCK